MKVAVTGGAGFIGSNLSEELCRDHDVVVIDRLSEGNEENIENLDVEFIRADITDMDVIEAALKGVDCVFHMAATASVQRSVDDPLAVNKNNIEGTLSVLVASKHANVRRFILSSSSSVYGDIPLSPKMESLGADPKSPYALSKLAGEYYCKIFSDLFGISTVSLRYFNVYGPKQDSRSEYSAVIPIFITRLLDGMPPIIYGNGNQVRDFVFVRDVVRANILSMESDARGVFNIGCGYGVSIRELAQRIAAITGQSLDPIYRAGRPGDIRESIADISSAGEMISYAPMYDLDSGLRHTIDWFKSIRA